MSVFFIVITVSAQVKLTGRVTDTQNGKPLGKVIVSVRDKDNRMKGYAQTKTDGSYVVLAQSIEGCLLHFSIIGYKKRSIELIDGRTVYDVTLEQSAIELKEVKVYLSEEGSNTLYSQKAITSPDDAVEAIIIDGCLLRVLIYVEKKKVYRRSQGESRREISARRR